MNKILWVYVVLALMSALWTAPAGAGNIAIQNCGFEYPDVPPDSVTRTYYVPGWDIIGGTNAGVWDAPGAFSGLDKTTNFAWIWGFEPTLLRQTLGASYQAGKKYVLSFDVLSPDGNPSYYLETWDVQMAYNGGNVLATADEVGCGLPTPGGKQRMTLVYSTGSSGAELGQAIEIQFAGYTELDVDNFTLQQLETGYLYIDNSDFECPHSPEVPTSAGLWGEVAGWKLVGGNQGGVWNYPACYNQLSETTDFAWVFSSTVMRQTLGAVYEPNKYYCLEFDQLARSDNPARYPNTWNVDLAYNGGSVFARVNEGSHGLPPVGGKRRVRLECFTGSSGAELGQTIEIQFTGDGELDADNFSLRELENIPVYLTIEVVPDDKGIDTITPPPGRTQFVTGMYVTIDARTFYDCPGGRVVLGFDHWQGEGISDPKQNPITILMDADKTITAVFVDAARCGDQCHPYPAGDANKDCVVDLQDLIILSQYWLE
jgi:hypothetical protein